MCPFQGDVSDFTKRVRSDSLLFAFSYGDSLKPYYLTDFYGYDINMLSKGFDEMVRFVPV